MTTIIPREETAATMATTAPAVLPKPPIRPARGGAGAWRAFRHRPLAVASLAYLLVLVIAAVGADAIAPYDPVSLDLDHVLSGPTAEHLLGTDAVGRDVLSRLIYGGQLSLVDAALALAIFLFAGVSSGLVAGFLGGWADRVFSWVVDIVLAIPGIIVVLVVLTVFGGSLTAAMISVGVLAAPGLARVVRGVTMAVRQEPYIAAARVSGLPRRRIVVNHVLPRVVGPIVVQASLFAGGALLIDAGLGYLGYGAEPPTPTWGGMITEAASVMSTQPWLLVPSGAVLGLAILALGLIGDAVRDTSAERIHQALPRSRNRPSPTPAVAAPTAVRASTGLLSMRDVSIALPSARGETTVVEGVSMEIHAGETVGLVGESGCGKSITASAILGILPAEGRVSGGLLAYDGADLAATDASTWRRLRGAQIAMISQEPVASLDPVFTAGQQVAELIRRHHQVSRRAAAARAVELLADVRLRDPEAVARRYPHELSGGMAQRVAIAMALAGGPRLLIADEPTTALDVTVQAEVLKLLATLQAEHGMAILLITHDWGVVAQLCTRAYVMYAGQIVETGAVTDLLTRPLHPYTAGLLAATPRRSQPGQRLDTVRGSVPTPGEWPAGCHFAPRCGLATPECSAAPIPLVHPEEGHDTRCIHHTQLTGRRPHG